MKQRPGDQQLPVENGEVDCQETLLDRLVDDIPKRRAVGIARYGTGLQPFNGRDAGRDAYEEWLDLGAYLEQMRREAEARAETLDSVRRYAELTLGSVSIERRGMAEDILALIAGDAL